VIVPMCGRADISSEPILLRLVRIVKWMESGRNQHRKENRWQKGEGVKRQERTERKDGQIMEGTKTNQRNKGMRRSEDRE